MIGIMAKLPSSFSSTPIAIESSQAVRAIGRHGSLLYLRIVAGAGAQKRSLEIRTGSLGVSEVQCLAVQYDVLSNQPVVPQVGCREGGERFINY